MSIARTVLTASAVVLMASAAWAATPVFSIAVYPDSQNSPGQVNTEVTWTINNQSTYNISFATHEGDITGDGSAGYFSTVSTAMHRLDNLMPWGTVPGNHDYYGISNYDTYFGPSQFAGKSWYGGSYDRSSWVTFQGGTRTFIGLEIQNAPTPEVLTWAQGVIDAHPTTPVVLTTHNYLTDQVGLQGRTSDVGEAMWNNFVKKNNQIFMVLCGHVHSSGGSTDGEWNQTSTNIWGRPVYELLADYQDRNNGMMRIMIFDEDANAIYVKTMITYSGLWETDASSQFTLPMDYDWRLAVPEPTTMALVMLGGAMVLRRRRR